MPPREKVIHGAATISPNDSHSPSRHNDCHRAAISLPQSPAGASPLSSRAFLRRSMAALHRDVCSFRRPQIVFNFTGIAIVGAIVEQLFGPRLWLVLYFLSGLIGEFAGLLWQP